MEEKEVVDQPKENNEIKMSKNFLFMLFALVSVAITLLTVVLVIFGVYNNIVHGIVCLFACVLPIVGAILTYITAKKPTFELYINLFALALALLCLKIW